MPLWMYKIINIGVAMRRVKRRYKVITVDGDKYMCCSGCKQYMPLTAKYYYKDKGAKYGYDAYCKKCRDQIYGFKKGFKKEKYNMLLIMDEWEKKAYNQNKKIIELLEKNNWLRLPQNLISLVDKL
jgi:hypothetical protein